MQRSTTLIGALLVLAGCVQPYSGPPVAAGPRLATQDQTAGTEEQDRINRFRRLANMRGISPPEVEQTLLPPGSVGFMAGPVPIVRVVFPEKAFFAFDSAIPLPSAAPILDIIAANMKRDVPDAALTVLGHTDAIGTDAYNIDLSRRRAEAVMQALVTRGVSSDQLSEVAIGKRQPIAPNDTLEGRALNRRVEFLVSPALSANLAAVQQRVVPATYFQTEEVQPRTLSAESSGGLASIANVYKLTPSPSSSQAAAADEPKLSPVGGLPLSPASVGPVEPSAIAQTTATQQSMRIVSLAPTMPVAPVQLIPPSQVQPRQLGNIVTY